MSETPRTAGRDWRGAAVGNPGLMASRSGQPVLTPRRPMTCAIAWSKNGRKILFENGLTNDLGPPWPVNQSKLSRLFADFLLVPAEEACGFRHLRPWARSPNSQCRTPDIDHSQQRVRCAPSENASAHTSIRPAAFKAFLKCPPETPVTRVIRTVAGTSSSLAGWSLSGFQSQSTATRRMICTITSRN